MAAGRRRQGVVVGIDREPGLDFATEHVVGHAHGLAVDTGQPGDVALAWVGVHFGGLALGVGGPVDEVAVDRVAHCRHALFRLLVAGHLWGSDI